MTIRCQYQNSNDIGVFTKLTNSYNLIGEENNQSFISKLESKLSLQMPVIHCTISDTSIIGRLCVGNKNGLLVPSSITYNELQHLRNSLPDNIKIKKLNSNLSAIGNCISCNDHVALIHPDFDTESEEIIGETLGVEVFKTTVAGSPLLGSYTVFNNNGGLVHPLTTIEEFEEISNLLQIPIISGTVNRGIESIGAGLVVNDWISFCGNNTTSTEIDNIVRIFDLEE